MLPPGVLQVAIDHSTFPFGSSKIRSTLVYRPLMPFSSLAASSASSGRLRSMGIEMINLVERVSSIAMHLVRLRRAYPVRGELESKCMVCRTVNTLGATGGEKV